MLQKNTKMRSMHFFPAAFLKNQLTSVTNSRQTFIHCMLLPVSKKIFVSYRNWCWFRQHCQMLPSLSLVRNLWSLVFKIMAKLFMCSLAESMMGCQLLGQKVCQKISVSKRNTCDDIYYKMVYFGISIHVLSWRQQKDKCLFWLLRYFLTNFLM